MTDLQQVELQLLTAFVEVCDVLGLRYYLLGGTLLGAVRHGGFIPWDDDIDVGMPREDYETFLRQAQNLLPENLFLQTYETDPECPLYFAKLRNSDTAFVETSVCKKRMNHGVYIDIFPLDYYPSSIAGMICVSLQKHILQFRLWQDYFSRDKDNTVKRCAKLAIQWITYIPLRLIYPASRDALRAFDRTIKRVPKSAFLCNYCGAWGSKEIAPAEWFGEGVPIRFESLTALAPKEYDLYLTRLYGDYMIPPPEKSRVGHHYAEVIDTTASYRDLKW